MYIKKTLNDFILLNIYETYRDKTILSFDGDPFVVKHISIEDGDPPNDISFSVYLADRNPNQTAMLPEWPLRCRTMELFESMPQLVNLKWNDKEKRWLS